MSDMEHQSDVDNDNGAVSDQTNNGRATRSSKSSTVMMAADKVKSMEQDMKKLFNHQHTSNKYMKDVKAQLNQIMTALKQLPTDASITTTTTSSSSSQSDVQWDAATSSR
jgi:seryl-tRNA synthetase